MNKINKTKQYVKVTKTSIRIVDTDNMVPNPEILIEEPKQEKIVKSQKHIKTRKVKHEDEDQDDNVEDDDDQPIIQKKIEKDAPKNIPDPVVPNRLVVRNVAVVNLKKEAKIIKGYEKQLVDDVRKARGKQQKIFLILTHEYDEDELERRYEVMGTTGNVYTVSIVNSPTCTCPDYTTRNKRCKHIYFVLTRIMKVKPNQEDIEKYLDDDLQDMFENIPQITENLRVDAHKLAKFKTLKKNGNGEVEKREIDEEAMCPICLAELYDCDEELIFCRYSCGYSLHKQCFDMYNSKQHGECKCIFCQKPWENEFKKQYMNIE